MTDQEQAPEVVQQEEQVTQENETIIEETSTQQDGVLTSAQTPPVESEKEINIRMLRESKERAERERDELLKRLDSIEKQMKPEPVSEQPKEEEQLSYNPDDLIEGRHLSQYEKKLVNLEKQLQSYQQQTAAVTVENKLKSQYSDFDAVVTKENLELLRSLHPEVAQTINSTSDLYSKAVSAYTIIKNLGIKPAQTYDAEKRIAQQNSAKPKPLASVSPQQGKSPLSRANAFANGLTEELKESLRREMAEIRKRS